MTNFATEDALLYKANFTISQLKRKAIKNRIIKETH